MIIDRAFIREVAHTSIAVTLVIVSILFVVRLVRFLSQAASGDIPVDSIFILLSLKIVTYMDLILPLMLYAAILMVMSRWIKDNEMTVLQACGIGLKHLLRPTLILTSVVTLIVAAFSFYLTPFSIATLNRIMEESKQRTEISSIVPGVFNDQQGRGVYYVERLGETEDTVSSIFVYGKSGQKEGVVVAEDGYQYVDEQTGDRFLVLKNGTRYEGIPGQADYSTLKYETYALRVKTNVEVNPPVSVKAMPTARLLESDLPRAIPEWHWRIAKPLVVPILSVLALSFSYIGARKSQFMRMVVAFGVYFLYANLLGYGHALLQKGKISPDIGLWWVHGLFVLVAVYMFARRAQNKPLLFPLKLRRSGAQ